MSNVTPISNRPGAGGGDGGNSDLRERIARMEEKIERTNDELKEIRQGMVTKDYLSSELNSRDLKKLLCAIAAIGTAL